MAFRDVLLQLRSYPDPTPISAVDQAVQFSELLGAHISALTFEIRIKVPGNPLAKTILDIPGMIATERGNSVRNARDLLCAFDTAATGRALVHRHMVECCMTVEIPDIVTEYARMHDLTIVPIEEQAAFQQRVAECVIFGSGRPVLLLPAASKRAGPVRLDTIGLAWDFSRPAARALADALPLLLAAKRVRVVTVTNEKRIETRRSASELARNLAAHGLEVVLETQDAAGLSIGGALTKYATVHGLDLLVMGAYGHSRLRDFVQGGATRSMVANPPLPVFLSH
jgi:nucleotide-binding universal stress UspA family protein